MKSSRFPRSRLLLRVYLFGVLMLALASGATFLVSRFVITPAVEGPARPSTAWIAWHLLESVDEPERVAFALRDLKKRVHVEMTLFSADGTVLVSNVEGKHTPLTAAQLAELKRRGSTFGDGRGAVALRDGAGNVLRYARVDYPVQEAPISIGIAQLVAALMVLAVLSIPMARSITAPLERLGAQARAFGAGDLSVQSGLVSQDEIGDLARAFDDMAARVVNLRKSEKELLANVSHELRTPLQRIRIALEMVREGRAESAAGYLSDIEEDLGELERLLDDVMTAARLDLSRGTHGDPLPPLRWQRLSARDLVDAARARFEMRVRGRTLLDTIADDAPSVDADPSLLRRVLDNLLDNASKFSDPHTPIEIHAARGPGGALVVDVADHG
ncbi:MAG TPA: HAMP domain-containing sensor histidine kinase, partial [Polyangiaceae bacterium]|nr:HAMP domain-containing sensor histidine kinase [Polyangiaceae bacterium]